MRSLKSTTSASTTSSTTTTTATAKGKRKLAQAKEYPDSPPATPPTERTTATTRGKKQSANEGASPPAKRRRSSNRIADKTGQKRQSMEDDDGFVFTRAPKRKTQTTQAQVNPPPKPVAKPFVMDFTADVLSLVYGIRVDNRPLLQLIRSKHLVNQNARLR